MSWATWQTTLFFTASTFKVPILVELYRQVDRGIVDPTARLELTDEVRSPGGGTLKELDSGLRLTIHDLAMLMIIVSDNTATDMLYNLVGRDSPQRHDAEDLGLERTSLPMTCKELLYSMYGVETGRHIRGNPPRGRRPGPWADGARVGRAVRGALRRVVAQRYGAPPRDALPG